MDIFETKYPSIQIVGFNCLFALIYHIDILFIPANLHKVEING